MRWQPLLPAVPPDRLKAEGATRIPVVPLYPSTPPAPPPRWSTSLPPWLASARNQPGGPRAAQFPRRRRLPAALAQRRRHWQTNGPPDERYRLVMEFPRPPRRSLTWRPLPLRMPEDRRPAGRAPPACPLTAPWSPSSPASVGRRAATLHRAPLWRSWPGRASSGGCDLPLVFVGDCLETLEEIALGGQGLLPRRRGKTLHYIPALNEEPAWIAALASLVERHLAGWPTRDRDDAAALAESGSPGAGSGRRKLIADGP